jgi:hypothetical protein
LRDFTSATSPENEKSRIKRSVHFVPGSKRCEAGEPILVLMPLGYFPVSQGRRRTIHLGLMKSKPGVWFATCQQVAQFVKDSAAAR